MQHQSSSQFWDCGQTELADYFGPFAGRAFIYVVEGALNINKASFATLQLVNGVGPSDESQFEVFGGVGDGHDYVWRNPEEKYNVNCLVPTFKSGCKGVMVWGCFSSFGLGPLVQ
ncbi:7649_t:CDS:2, partial [Paraglomus brasilianum]